jgi:hypothetical protein
MATRAERHEIGERAGAGHGMVNGEPFARAAADTAVPIAQPRWSPELLPGGAVELRGWLGLAQIWVTSSGHITRGTVKVNDTYFNTPKYNTTIWRASVMCQEIGHTWGLDHQDESGADFHTCMDYATNPDADNTHPNRHDYEELALIYSHVDVTATIGRSAAHSARVLRVDRKGRSVVERRFADGSRQVTFIIWAR